MNTITTLQNRFNRCISANSWLIIAAIAMLITITSCVPPMNGTTGQRAGKKEVQLANMSYSKSKKYSRTPASNREREESAQSPSAIALENEIDEENSNIEDIQNFEKKLVGSAKNKENESQNTKAIPSLNQQLEDLKQKQTETDESIGNIKGDLLEIKTMISEIVSDKTNPQASVSAVRPVNSSHGLLSRGGQDESAQSPSAIALDDAPAEEKHDIIESDEQAEKPAPKAEPKPEEPKKAVPPAPKANKNFKIVKASAPKTPAKPQAAEPKKVEEPKNNNTAMADNNNSKPNANNDFSTIIATIAKKDFAAATKQINEKMKSTSDKDVVANCNYWLGECSFNQRDYAKSIEYYKQALNKQCDKKDIAQAKIAEAYMRVGKNSEAKMAFQTLLKDYPKSAHTPKAKKMLQQL